MRHLIAILFLASLPARGSTDTPAQIDYHRDIAPVFEQHCLKCHGPDEQNGGIRYDQKARATGIGDSGKHPIVPGQPDQSELLRRITSTHKDEQMPPKGARLDSAVVETFRAWIASGAEWPESGSGVAEATATSDHWSFQPITQPEPPTVKDPTWAINPIDRFIQSAREEAGLTPAPDTDPRAFIRRLSYDLTGLPPTPDEVAAFLSDLVGDHQTVRQSDEKQAPSTELSLSDSLIVSLSSPLAEKAIANLTDRLLNKQAYGERWGRHWLDWVRYADTAGDNSDYPIPQAYLYRNYVIESLNNDVPYDRFLTEQLAGDLLPAKTQEERNRQVIATGYLAMARRFGSLVEGYPQHLTIEDTIDNLGRTVMGLTLSCARCHDHKFDPVSTRDYYGLYGIFASTRYPFPGIELFKAQRDFVPLIPEKEAAAKLKPTQQETDKLTAELERLLAECDAKALDNAAKEPSATIEQQRKMAKELDGMMHKARKAGEALAIHLKKLPDIPTAYAVRDAQPANARVQIKGEPTRPGAEVPRKFPDVLGGQSLAEETHSGRLELAQWITDSKNPLTARVIVNRVWQRHFGKGLVSTTGDFGLRGEKPTHPELLDWLASDFMANGWSLKHLHRLIVTSRTYRMSCQDTEDNLASDPANTRYWKFNRQRLDAESIRDTLLALGGTLDPEPQAKPYPIPAIKDWGYTQHHPFKDDYPTNKRSVYQMTKRLTVAPYMQTFDGADPNVCTSTRDSSVTALQALYFVNDTFLHEQADRFAKQLVTTSKDDAQRLEAAFLTTLARPPTADESQLLLAHLQTARQQSKDDTAVWASVTRTLFRLNEFLYLD